MMVLTPLALVLVAATIVETLDGLGVDYPKLSEAKLKELQAAKAALL